jgi:hypothetical protein
MKARMPIILTRVPPAFAGGERDPRVMPASGVRAVRERKRKMRVGKKEWTLMACVAVSVAGFGGWLRGEIDHAALARTERVVLDSADPHGSCAGMTVRDSAMMDKGMLWCGSVDAAHAAAARAASLHKS